MSDTKKIDKEIANNLELAFSRRGKIKRVKKFSFFFFYSQQVEQDIIIIKCNKLHLKEYDIEQNQQNYQL